MVAPIQATNRAYYRCSLLHIPPPSERYKNRLILLIAVTVGIIMGMVVVRKALMPTASGLLFVDYRLGLGRRPRFGVAACDAICSAVGICRSSGFRMRSSWMG